ncbi:MAG: phosphoribosylaminoimidazolesuccinocarboxamide synthase [Bacteroidetes bacterium QS_1_63_11]|nr:MAG: phosphoribosylaminoimidazolesuccinocarboxamide synthase [Bacteroidetes bacterium QS_1_63_11]
MDAQIIDRHLDQTLRRTEFDDLGERVQGKVRDNYRQDGRRILITTDRISAFDHVLAQTIPFKGQVLNQTAAYFFKATADLVPNHVLSVPDPNVTVARECTPIPVEFVVRGYLAGHAWREYERGVRTLCGQDLPDGLRRSEKLPTPIPTPTTKAEEGHDHSEMAAEQGLLLVDTKYEFGRTQEGDLVLIDEVHTPDSSRYYYQDGYQERLRRGEPQRQLSKEFVREWLMDHGFQGKEGQEMPDLPDAFRTKVTKRYVELYETVTGASFDPELHPDPEERIHAALVDESLVAPS